MSLDQKQVERVVLDVVLELHPDHLSSAELVLKIAEGRDEAKEITDAIHNLKGSGLLRYVGDAVAPTDAALHANALLTL